LKLRTIGSEADIVRLLQGARREENLPQSNLLDERICPRVENYDLCAAEKSDRYNLRRKENTSHPSRVVIEKVERYDLLTAERLYANGLKRKDKISHAQEDK
jgi:hypothetical protein